MENIILTNTFDYFVYYKFNNVISYNFVLCKPKISININKNTLSLENQEIYYIFDCPGDDAFGHWFYECFIFYKNIIELTALYPKLKILTSNNKNYVKLFLNLFNINNEIIYLHTNCRIHKEVPNKNNICFFSKIISLNDNNPHLQNFEGLVNKMIVEINTKIPFLNPNKILLLPRNTVDNYAQNDRIQYGTEDIAKYVIKMGGIVLDTYNLNNLYYQFTMIKNSDIIIVDYGSSCMVNTIFLKNKKIIILNNYNTVELHNNILYPLNTIVFNTISKNNDVVIVYSKNNNRIEFVDIEKYII